MNSNTQDQAQVFGTVFVEVVFPVGLRSEAPLALDGWTCRLWPTARLGDATLEAWPSESKHGPSKVACTPGVPELLAALRAQGLTPLGVQVKRQSLPCCKVKQRRYGHCHGVTPKHEKGWGWCSG